MNPQRIAKSLQNFKAKPLVPLATPAVELTQSQLRVSGRLLVPSNYDIKFSQFLGSNRLWKGPFTTLDLKHLQSSLDDRTVHSYRDPSGGYLFVNCCDSLSVYRDTAVIFPDGALVTWFMDRDRESQFVRSILNSHYQCDNIVARKSSRTESTSVDAFLSSELTESIALNESCVESNSSQLVNGGDSLVLTHSESERSNDILAISMALATAVRMNVMESYLEDHISNGHNEISKLLMKMNNWKLSKVSDSIFESEKLVHNWRYFLTQNGVDDVPDCLWEYGDLDKLYEQVMKNFDVHKRFNDINTDLTYYSEFLATCGEHVRHKYSSRLEKIIIAIIAIEAGIAMRHLLVDLVGNENPIEIVPVNRDTAIVTGIRHS